MPVQNSSQSDVGFSFCQLLISYLVAVLLFITMSTLWSLAWKWHIFAWYSKCALLRLFVLFDVRAWLNISFVSRVKAICWKTIFYLLVELDTIPSSARTIKRAALTKRWSSLCCVPPSEFWSLPLWSYNTKQQIPPYTDSLLLVKEGPLLWRRKCLIQGGQRYRWYMAAEA